MIKLEGWIPLPGDGDQLNLTTSGGSGGSGFHVLDESEANQHEAMIAAVHLIDNVTSVPAEVAFPGGEHSAVAMTIPAEIQMTRAAVVIAAAVVGIPACLGLLFTITCSRFLRNDRDNILVFHMAAVALFCCGVLAPVHGATLAMGDWALGREGCQAAGYLFSLCNQVTIWTIVFITANRYRLIARPLTCSNSASIASLGPGFLVLWLVSCACAALPFFLGQRYVYDPLDGACVLHNDPQHPGHPYAWIIPGVMTFYIPPIIVGLCYYRVFQISQRQTRRLTALVHLVTMTTTTITPTAMMRRPSHASLLGRKAPTTVAKYLGSFLALYLPYCLVVLLEAVFGTGSSSPEGEAAGGSTGRVVGPGTGEVVIGGFRVLAATLLHLAPAVHAVMYGVKNQVMWDTFVYQVRRKVLNPALRSRGRDVTTPRRDVTVRPPVIVLSPNSRTDETRGGEIRTNRSMPELNNPSPSNGLLATERITRATSCEIALRGQDV